MTLNNLFLAFFISISLAFSITAENSNGIDLEICAPTFCANSTIQSSFVASFCAKSNATVRDRCCLNETANATQLIGLDYSNCLLTSLKNATNLLRSQNDTKNTLNSIEIFDLSNDAVAEHDDDDYEGLLSLNELYLAKNCSCPGANYSWINVQSDRCIGQKNICSTNFSRVACTRTSQCYPNGPGNFLCLCKNRQHGYKCLENNQFPTLTFTLTFSLSTVFFCGLLYHTQRRHVLSKEERDANEAREEGDEEDGDYTEEDRRNLIDDTE